MAENPNFPFSNIAIVGVGLLGGSIGSAVRERFPGSHVLGVGRSEAKLTAAQELGAISSWSTQFPSALAESDLIVLCTPVGKIADQAIEIARVASEHAVITDVGSVKEAILTDVARDESAISKFIGSHPMAGSEKTGCEHASADLFVDRVVIVTPTENSDNKRVQKTLQFWQAIGARVVVTSPDQHDEAAALASHLPHVVAAALASTVEETAADFVATGWRDTTRIAAGDVQLWVDILLANKTATLASLKKFNLAVESFEAAIRSDDQEKLSALLTDGKKKRDAFGE